jgi:hypothetical protein
MVVQFTKSYVSMCIKNKNLIEKYQAKGIIKKFANHLFNKF